MYVHTFFFKRASSVGLTPYTTSLVQKCNKVTMGKKKEKAEKAGLTFFFFSFLPFANWSLLFAETLKNRVNARP